MVIIVLHRLGDWHKFSFEDSRTVRARNRSFSLTDRLSNRFAITISSLDWSTLRLRPPPIQVINLRTRCTTVNQGSKLQEVNRSNNLDEQRKLSKGARERRKTARNVTTEKGWREEFGILCNQAKGGEAKQKKKEIRILLEIMLNN